MKVLLILSALVAFAVAESAFKPEYYPVAKNFSTDPSLRVVGGQSAVRNQFPYQISLQRQSIYGFSHTCGGSILSENWILTAAHCTSGSSASSLRVVAGILLLNDVNVDGQQTRAIERIVDHPLYPGGSSVAPNDISLIHLAAPLQFTINVQPIPIPSQDHSSAGYATLSGWGLTFSGGSLPNNLQFATLPVVPEDECNRILTSLLGWQNPFSEELNVCSGTVQGYESACSGDSGGPLVKNGKVIGAVSWGLVPCGEAGAPSVYAKVSAYTNWIIVTTNAEVTPETY